MADEFVNQSERTFRAIRKPVIYGAVTGALVFALISVVLDILMKTGIGGTGLAVLGGCSFGGLAGFFVGLLRSHRDRRLSA